MRILKQDFRKGQVHLKVEDVEDLWYLSHLIEANDLVRGTATRKIKIGEGENAKVVRKIMTVKIEVEDVDFGAGGEILRLNGKVKEGPEEVPKDSYQSLSLEVGEDFILEKSQWLELHKRKLQEATEKKSQYLFCLFDREEALFALSKNIGYEILLKLKGEVSKKFKGAEAKKDFYQEIIQQLEEYNSRYQPEAVILASPAFFKEDLGKRITNPDLKKRIVLATCSDVGEPALDEVLKQPELGQALKSSRSRKEKILMEQLLNEINKNNLAVYGFKEVQKAIESGAATKLLLTDKFIQKQREAKNFLQLDQMMKIVDASQGEVHIFSSEQENGKTLEGLGGIAAILRYKLNY